jgi:hypothetical protein
MPRTCKEKIILVSNKTLCHLIKPRALKMGLKVLRLNFFFWLLYSVTLEWLSWVTLLSDSVYSIADWFDDNDIYAIQDRNRAYSRCRVLRTPENWKHFRLIWKKTSEAMRSANRHFVGNFFDLSGDPKRLNIRYIGLNNGMTMLLTCFLLVSWMHISVLSDQSHWVSWHISHFLSFPHTRWFFSRFLWRITSNATGLNGILLVFIKLFLPLILLVLLFNFILICATLPLVL